MEENKTKLFQIIASNNNTVKKTESYWETDFDIRSKLWADRNFVSCDFEIYDFLGCIGRRKVGNLLEK